MNTQILEYMIAISEEKNLSRAADRLLVTQPALSQQVKKLEKELGIKLFQRKNRELVLTDAGKIYVNGARSMMSIYNHALGQIQKIRTSGRKQITLVYNDALLPEFAAEILPAFRELHEDIFISSIYGNASVAKDYLTNGMAELAVMATNELNHSLLEYIPLRQEELMLALPAEHECVPVFREKGVDFSLLKDEAFILNQSNSYFRSKEREIFSHYQFTPNVLCEISDLKASRHMILHRKGIGFLPKSMEEGDEGCCCFSMNPAAVFYVAAAYPKSILMTGPVKDLLRLITRQPSGRTSNTSQLSMACRKMYS